ncbi:hypothetical protein CKM354_001175000 [Cercospora kikuchii]|uniref:DUF7587 domain-containing protein n=1 Tax=Cercospora kikuchii TaxID=84275 RepID=A0A9P3CYY4_9PEZI|nr:uncharacterized protein CKM354_001175000 [Cercospora kikuchii]GIZ48700.1 hypothetical protein CKM354_001175000 [Cercospora kikuchii]
MVPHSSKSHADDVFDSFKALSTTDHDVSKAELKELNQQVLKNCSDLVHSVRVLQAALAADEENIAQNLAVLSSLQDRIEGAVSAASLSAAASKARLLNKILSPPKKYEDIRRLSEFFKDDVKYILDEVLGANKDNETALRRVLEECYSQSAQSSGSLHASRWLAEQAESFLETPYDPDFQSEHYYEHEDRLANDENYAESWRVRREQESKQRERDDEKITASWVRFWRYQLRSCRDEPTLFWPLAQSDGCGEVPECPRYLFRAADDSSSGQNDADIIASAASMFCSSHSKKDLLLPKTRSTAADRLHKHLKKDCFGAGHPGNNLTSWSSSLLFVVQYALWRARKGKKPLDQVMIYAVDTTEFPRGQFAGDKWLLKKLGDDVPATSWEWSLIDLRARGYDNGEYLSQGVVNIKNRSCTMSLATLLSSGMYDLYPEFKDQNGSERWTKRVQTLRLNWATSQETTRKEIISAVRVAETCFKNFNCLDMAVLLLTFKNRRLSNDNESSEARGSWTEYGPVEVQRYHRVMQQIQARETINSSTWWGISMALERVFECEE